ncbi:MAG: nucleotide-binding protein [Dehalococcoidia bacterium]
MTAKRSVSSQQTQPQPPNLVIPRSEADKQIATRIDLGKQLLSIPMHSSQDYEGVLHNHKLWHEYNVEFLRRIFDSDELSKEYSFWGAYWLADNLQGQINQLSEDIATHITRLESIKQRLPLYPELASLSKPASPTSTQHPAPTTKAVFLVHGTDQAVKETVARYLMKLNLDPIILHEQPNLGDTIIEKLERTSPVAFSIVLLTPDDQACPITDTSTLKPRARQNVVFELGFFIGRLGREKVCALYTEGVELPSDFHGVVYIPFDASGAWRLSLARELKASGLDIDLNNAL